MKSRLLVALVLVASPFLVPSVANADEPPAPVVTWPNASQVHAGSYDYTITITGLSGYRRYFSDWQGEIRKQILGDGEFVVPLGLTNQSSQQSGRVRILSCLQATMDCQVVAESPELSVVGNISVFDSASAGVERIGADGVGSTRYLVGPMVQGLRLQWLLTKPSDEIIPQDPIGLAVLAAGDVPDPQAQGTAHYDIPDIVPAGRYHLYLRAEVSRDDFGHAVAWSREHVVILDRTAPRLGFEFRSGNVVYPVPDDRGDELWFDVRSDEGVEGKVEFISSAGQVVDVIQGVGNVYGGRDSVEWFGTRGGAPLPAGVYTARFTAADLAGNVAMATASVQVSHATYRNKKVRFTISAKDSLLDQSLGRCSRLVSPSSHRWRKSLGYVADARCSQPRQSGVVTLHGVRVPKLARSSGPDIEISAYGGAGRGDGRGRAVLSYLSRRGDVVNENGLGSRVRSYRGRRFDLGPMTHDAKGVPYVVWTVDVGPGRRYDVKNFTITIHFQVFA